MRVAPASRASATIVLTTLFSIFSLIAIAGWTSTDAEAANGSCQFSCGEYAGSCWCDTHCKTAGDCCADYANSCGDYGGSCSGKCGGSSGDGCWCDDACSDMGDCCQDYGTQCQGVTGTSSCSNDPSGVVDCCSGEYGYLGENCQQVGSQVEEFTPTDDCHGECGEGCSWYNCGGGAFCEIHDTEMDKGFWTFGQFATFPHAAVQWGACVVGTAVQTVFKVVKSAVTKAFKWVKKGISKLFN